jgi:hypothetical protein
MVVVRVGLGADVALFAMGVLAGNGVVPAFCLLAIMFIALFLPATKGHAVEEITRLFQQSARQAIPASEQDTRGWEGRAWT